MTECFGFRCNINGGIKEFDTPYCSILNINVWLALITLLVKYTAHQVPLSYIKLPLTTFIL